MALEWAGLTVPCPLDVGLLGAGSDSPSPSNLGLPARTGEGGDTFPWCAGLWGAGVLVNWKVYVTRRIVARVTAPSPRGGGHATRAPVRLCRTHITLKNMNSAR